MTEAIAVPPTESVSILELSVDGKNPNRMSREQLDRLKTSIQKFGFIVPIITNRDLLIADGEQRWTVAKELGMEKVSVIRLPVEDVDRRLLRQVLNKLRGEHSRELDADEFRLIIDEGHEKDLQFLLGLSDAKLESYLQDKDEASIAYEESFEVIVECTDEAQQESVYNKLIKEGFKCRISTL